MTLEGSSSSHSSSTLSSLLSTTSPTADPHLLSSGSLSLGDGREPATVIPMSRSTALPRITVDRSRAPSSDRTPREEDSSPEVSSRRSLGARRLPDPRLTAAQRYEKAVFITAVVMTLISLVVLITAIIAYTQDYKFWGSADSLKAIMVASGVLTVVSAAIAIATRCSQNGRPASAAAGSGPTARVRVAIADDLARPHVTYVPDPSRRVHDPLHTSGGSGAGRGLEDDHFALDGKEGHWNALRDGGEADPLLLSSSLETPLSPSVTARRSGAGRSMLPAGRGESHEGERGRGRRGPPVPGAPSDRPAPTEGRSRSPSPLLTPTPSRIPAPGPSDSGAGAGGGGEEGDAK